MSNTLTMVWNSTSSESFTPTVNKVKHGDIPTFSSSTLSSSTSSTTSAKQSNDLSPGPEGSYTWNTVDLTENVQCDYHFPAGSSGQLITITLSPSGNLQISFDNTNWTSSKLMNSWTSTDTTFSANLYVRDKPPKS